LRIPSGDSERVGDLLASRIDVESCAKMLDIFDIFAEIKTKLQAYVICK